MEPLNGINRDVCGAKLQAATVSAYPVDCDRLCHLLDIQYYCLCINGSLNPPSASHPLMHAIYDITVTVKKIVKIQQCYLASRNNYRTLGVYNYSIYTVNLAWLKSSTTEPWQLQYFSHISY